MVDLTASEGTTFDAVRLVAASEGVDPAQLEAEVAKGTVVILRNPRHRQVKPIGIGRGLRTKINANIGSSPDSVDLDVELAKLRAAVEAGADTVMDLSVGGDIDKIRRAIVGASEVPVGTVPIYQAAVEAVRRGRAAPEMSADDMFRAIEMHAQDGVDFVTVHCGVTRESVRRLELDRRTTKVVSRGGAILIEWMVLHDRENPLYEEYDRLLEIAKAYSVTLSLGDGLRPGSLADASDRSQIQELLLIGELVERARVRGVQAMVEGPGHVPLDQIEANVFLEKRACRGAPFYVLGPLVTDVACGYDHIAGAIGGAIAAAAGADFLCYVTPSEHLRLPSVEDVREGVIASRIAAHAGDLAKGVAGAWEQDLGMSRMRMKLDWEGMYEFAIDPRRARALHDASPASTNGVCTMCGEYCAVKKMAPLFEHGPDL